MPGWVRQCPPVPHPVRSNSNSGFLKLQVRQGWAPIPAEIQREELAAARAYSLHPEVLYTNGGGRMPPLENILKEMKKTISNEVSSLTAFC
ncbi:Integrin Alpha-4 [Manis pentadactyla]|nr:Integrin Alpha-4 [Manis pentadactyla]